MKLQTNVFFSVDSNYAIIVGLLVLGTKIRKNVGKIALEVLNLHYSK